MSTKYTPILSKRKSYLQLAMNSTLHEAAAIIHNLPVSERILIEAGTPLIKRYGINAIRELRALYDARLSALATINTVSNLRVEPFGRNNAQIGRRNSARSSESAYATLSPYIVADLKTMDRGATEAELAASAGASGAIALGNAPIETLNSFINACHANGIDAMVDMMNVEYPISILRLLKTPPEVVILHRGVDEERDNKQKMLPLHEIRRIKGAYDVIIAIAGGDTLREVQSASFNDADIVVVWKSVYESSRDTSALVENFLKTIK